MRPILLALALCAAGAAAQNFGGEGGRRRRLRPSRPRRPITPLRPEPQLAEEQTLVPYSLQEQLPLSRDQFQPQPQPQPERVVTPQYQLEPETARPASSRPTLQNSRPTLQNPRPKLQNSRPTQISRTDSRYQLQQLEPEYADYAPETDRELLAEEDYVDEPDRLSILMLESSFKCDNGNDGYFADDSVNCEVFHYCAAGVKHSWICPDGHKFHQVNLICQPEGSDPICQRSKEFAFVNEYLYQQINNDSLRPQYADRFYPDTAAAGQTGDSYAARPKPQAVYTQRREQDVSPPRRRLRRPQPAADFGGNQFDDSRFNNFGAGFRQPQSQSVIRPQQKVIRPVVESFDPSAFRAQQEEQHQQQQRREQQQSFQPSFPEQQGFQRRREDPLPSVRPQANPFPEAALRPSINFRGAPRSPAQERRDEIVLGGFQGNVDIEDLASRAGQ